MMPRASFRLFRTGLIASIVFGLAAGGHLAGAGSLPAPAVLAALCAVTMVPVAALTRFRLSFPVLTGLIGAGQIWLHWAFIALSGGAPAAVPPAVLSGHAGHSGHAASLGHESLAGAAQAHAFDVCEHQPATPRTRLQLLPPNPNELLNTRCTRPSQLSSR